MGESVMGVPITNTISWVGKVDWELRKFHGEEFSTHRGTSYNSYLIRGEKTVLIETVWATFAKEYVDNLQKEINLNSIDYIIANHGEIDHSGALPELMRLIPETPIYCTANCVKSLKGQYHQEWNFRVVKNGDRLNLGNKELIFIEAPMLHWPDSMFCYLTGDNVLFSTDAFGQHLATEKLFNDLVDQSELLHECLKYYANILTPFSSFVERKIKEFVALNLPLDMICTSHGVVWRDNPLQIVTRYLKWASGYQENQITIIYDSMWDATRKMAEAIAQGIGEEDGQVLVKLFNIARGDKNDIITEVFRSKAILVGSPTVNKGVLSAIAGILEEIRGLGFKEKKAAAFGAYGWSGESVKMITQRLAEGGFTIVNDGLKLLWNPDEQGVAACATFGRDFCRATADPVPTP
jgi:anaerobic nitric oxide reductase flavorubredoxin